MHFHQCSLVGGLKRFMLFVLLTTLLVSGENKDPSVVLDQHYQPHNMPEKQQKLHQHQNPRYPFGVVYFSQKRKLCCYLEDIFYTVKEHFLKEKLIGVIACKRRSSFEGKDSRA
ncbi:hypothetical protein CR513_59943, partial [Mucuna pruriens]